MLILPITLLNISQKHIVICNKGIEWEMFNTLHSMHTSMSLSYI